jgi:uroporphyrinogen-III decarboxylase
MFRNPELLHKLLELCVRTQIEYIKALEEVSGGSEFIFIGDDIPGLVSQKFADEFGFRYMKRIYDSFSGKIRVYHNDSKTMHMLEQIGDLDVQLFNFSFQNDLKIVCVFGVMWNQSVFSVQEQLNKLKRYVRRRLRLEPQVEALSYLPAQPYMDQIEVSMQ